MDKEEFRIKLEEINHLVELQDYKGAMSVVDSIDWRRVKNVRTLCVVGEIYAANKRYEESREIFLLAYHRAPIGKNILYRLVEVSLKIGDIEEALEFYDEYLEVAPNDNTQYVLKYKIYKAKNASLNEQIKILEDYKEKEFTEKWSYELAKLYYKAGEKEKCLDLCNEMVLWFSEGKYVIKALDLKLRLGALTGEEKEKYEQQFIPKLITPEEAKAMKENGEEGLDDDSASTKEQDYDNPVIESIRMDEKDINNAESLQERISKGIRDIFSGKKREKEEEEEAEETDSENEEIQEEMIKDISSRKETFIDVPDLEPENEENLSSEKKNSDMPIKMPKLNIPDSMKNMGIKEEKNVPEENVEEEEVLEEPGKIFDFNLEDTILAAATAQGIEIPDENNEDEQIPEEPEKEVPEISEESIKEPEEIKQPETASQVSQKSPKQKSARPVQNLVIPDFVRSEEDDDEIMTEEDLREAEAEFLNGPSGKAEAEDLPSLDIDDEEEDDLDEIPVKPKGMNTEVFHFQQELKKALEKEEKGKEDGFFNDENSFDDDFDEEEEDDLTEEEELEKFIDSINPEAQRDILDIVPRERKMTEDEEKLFTYLAKVPGLKEQIVETLCDVQLAASDKTSRTGNVIVMGARETGKTRLISGLIPAICKELKLEASKVAYVFAEQINGKDIAEIVNKLSGGFFVIENANQLTPETVKQLDKAMEFRTDGLTVIIEDEKIGMRKLIARFPKFAKKFTSMINIPVFTNDELVNFAKVYTKENGYTIDQMGMLALYNLISVNQKEDEPMNIGTVKELIDNAIAKSQGGIRKLKRNISKKRTDRDGFIVLYEKDFN